MFLLDTNVVSELRKAKAGKANLGVTDWATGVSAALMFLSVVSVHELENAVKLAEPSDPSKGEVLREWFDGSVLPAFSDRVLNVDEPVALRAAGLHVPDPAPFRDALIGATAIVHGMAIVTRNVSDFDRFAALELVNPWT